MFCLAKVPNLVSVSFLGSDMTSVLSQDKVFSTAIPLSGEDGSDLQASRRSLDAVVCISEMLDSLGHLMLQFIHTTDTGNRQSYESL